MGSPVRLLACGALLLAAQACASGGPETLLARDPRVATSQVGEIQLNIQFMLSFDANKDGVVTREELDAGLKRQFDAADTDHNGSLSLSEAQAENRRRWQASGTASSPLIDWNQDGVVSFAEFSAAAQSVFTQLDRDRGGTLAGAELTAPRIRTVRQPPRRQVGNAGAGV